MHPRLHRWTAVIGATALTAGGGIGVAQAAKSTTHAARTAQAGTRQAGPRASFAADIAKALNVDTAKVQAILDANRPKPPDHGSTPPAAGTRPDRSALVSALAKGLGVDESAVTAALDTIDKAHRADETARRAAYAAALAKELGLSTDKVQAALDKVGPPGGHGPGGFGPPGPPPAGAPPAPAPAG